MTPLLARIFNCVVEIVDIISPRRLKLYYEQMYSTGLPEPLDQAIKTRVRCRNIKKHVLKKLSSLHYPYLIASNYFDGKYWPIVDADDQKSLATAGLWLSENNMEYAVIESSDNHYWIILDRPCRTQSQSILISSLVPGNDREYVNFIKENGTCVRAHFKLREKYGYNDKLKCSIDSDAVINWFMPRIVAGEPGSVAYEFAQAIVNHFESDEIKWSARAVMYLSENAELDNPENGEKQGFVLEDMLA